MLASAARLKGAKLVHAVSLNSWIRPPSWSRRSMAEVDGRRARSVRLDESGRCEVERAVRPVCVVVVDEDAEHALKVSAVHDP